MKYGLTSTELENIVDVFRNSPEVKKAILFGSRAKGNYRPGSDIDIAVYGKDLSFDQFLALKVKLDMLDLLQKIDLIKFESVDNPDFVEHINRVGITIYNKTE